MIRTVFVGIGVVVAAGIAATPLRSFTVEGEHRPALMSVAAPHRTIGPDVEPAQPLDATINTNLKAHGLSTQLATAVVPIVGSGGSDATLRMAQVSGPSASVSRVKAVLEIDTDNGRGHWQYTALVPVSSVADNGRGRRVDGIGVTAIITK